MAAALVALAVGLTARPLRAQTEQDWTVGRTTEVFGAGDGLATRVGGSFDAAYEDNDLPDAHHSLGLNHLNVFFDTRYGDRWQLFTELEYEHQSDLTGFEAERSYDLEQLYARFRWSDALQLQLGRFNTPFGYWTPINWNILMDSIRAPMHVEEGFTPDQQRGLAVTGNWYATQPGQRVSDLRYIGYVGYGGDSDSFERGARGGFSAGLDLRLELARGDFAGVSFYQQRVGRVLPRTEQNFAVYADFGLSERLRLLGEHVRQSRSNTDGTPFDRELELTYLTLHWQLHPKFYLSYRYNWGDADSGTGTDSRAVHTLSFGYQPVPSLKLKLEYADQAFRSSSRRGFRYWALSIGGLF